MKLVVNETFEFECLQCTESMRLNGGEIVRELSTHVFNDIDDLEVLLTSVSENVNSIKVYDEDRVIFESIKYTQIITTNSNIGQSKGSHIMFK